jgi:mRNA interferase RelE/StbE
LSYKIAFKKSVSRDLKKISKNEAERILKRIEENLPEKAGTFPSLTGSFAGMRKFRVGEYRVIFTIVEDTALILRISHRRESYR